MKPKCTTKTNIGFIVLATMLCVPFLDAKADSASYTFEAPQFSVNQLTPMLNRSPNNSTSPLGAAFLTTFTGTPNASGLRINSTITLNPNVLFSGQYQYVPLTTNEVLTMSFNGPVMSLDLDFAIATTLNGGFLRVITSSESLDQPAVSVGIGQGFFGGHVSFNSLTPFTSVQLAGFSSPGMPMAFAIDNMTVTIVPEPTICAMLALGIAALFTIRYSRKDLATNRNA